MTLAGLPAPQLAKEARALLPIWAGTLMAMVATRALGAPQLGLFTFAIGTAALGAWCTGHEYAYRTLGPLLALPVRRTWLLGSKLAVLIPMLGVLALVCWLVLLQTDAIARELSAGEQTAPWRLAVVLATPLLGLGIAPWLAVICRSAMAGVVFTIAVPAVLLMAAHVARAATVGFEPSLLAFPQAFTLLVGGTVVAAAGATLAGWRAFVRQDAIDGAVPGRGLPGTAARAAARRPRHPIVVLAAKEVRLYPLALAVAALYVAAWIAMRLAGVDRQIAGQSFESIAIVYSLFIAVLVGATASAEERALGVTAAQVLQPYAFWKQWAVKTAIVVLVAWLLGPVLVVGLESVVPMIGDTVASPLARMRLFGTGFGGPAMATAGVAIVSLHVSTLSSGSLKALLLALTSCVTLSWLYSSAYMLAYRFESSLIVAARRGPLWWRDLPTVQRSDFEWSMWAGEATAAAALTGILLLALLWGMRNHRSAERAAVLARRQLLALAIYAAAAGILIRVVPAAVLAYMVTH